MNQEWNPAGYLPRKEYYAAVGYLCNQWNVVEHFYYQLASGLLGLEYKQKDILLRHFGTVAIGQFLNEWAAEKVKSKETREQLAFVSKYVEICRVNRNAIVHGIFAIVGDALFEITSKADQRRAKSRKFTVSLSEVRQCSMDCEHASSLCIGLQFALSHKGMRTAKKLFGPRWRARLLAKSPLPRELAGNPPNPPKPPRQPRPSRASRRREALARAKK